MDIDFDKAIKPEDFETSYSTDIDAAKHNLMVFRSSVQSMQAEVDALEVKDAATEKKGAEMVAQVKKLGKAIVAKQDDIIGEAQEFVKGVQQFTLPFRKDLEGIEKAIKAKLSDYAYRKEQERRKAEEAARKAAEEAQKRIDADAKAHNVEPVQLPAPVIPKQAAPVRTESGTTSYVSQWTYEVEDVGKIPARYLAADPTNRAAVMESIRAGVRQIDGLRIFEKMVTRTR